MLMLNHTHAWTKSSLCVTDVVIFVYPMCLFADVVYVCSTLLAVNSSWWRSVVHSLQSLQLCMAWTLNYGGSSCTVCRGCNRAWHDLFMMAVCRAQFAEFTIMQLCMAWTLNSGGLSSTVCRVYNCAWLDLLIMTVRCAQFAEFTIERGINS